MNLSIENMDNRPWYPHHIPTPLRVELYRRILDVGIYNADINPTYSWNDDSGKSYRGPLTPWHRVCSNGTGVRKLGKTNEQPRNGFILTNNAGLLNTYGFNAGGLNVLGWDANGKPHNVENAKTLYTNDKNEVPLYMPSPGIVSIEASIQKERIRKVVLNWKCYGFAQLEYLTPYFLTPGISVMVEFGWNHYNQYDPLIDYTDLDGLKKLYADGTPLYQKVLNSNGMYDATLGIIAGFEFSSPDGIVYECKTEVWSKHRNHTGVFINNSPRINKLVKGNDTQIKTKPSLYEFFNSRLKKVSRCLDGNGFNFFDPLDDGEISRTNDADTELAAQFYDGKIENRIFIGRGRSKNDPLKETQLETDWDYGESDKTWITMGFLVELLNLFIPQEINVEVDKTPISLYQMNISDCIIGGHPNLISCDGNVMLIPNASAPKFNLGRQYWTEDYRDKKSGAIDFRELGEKNKFQYQVYPSPTEKVSPNMTPFNRQLYQVFRTGYADFQNDGTYIGGGAYRDDLDVIINRFQYEFGNNRANKGDLSFPQYKELLDRGGRKQAGYWGYLKNIYVNVELVIALAKSSTTSKEFYDNLLKRLVDASAGLWDLEIVESESSLKIIDKKFIDATNIKENIYQFDISSMSNLRGISFTANMSNTQANQVIAGSSNNTDAQGLATASELPDFIYADRLGVNQIVPEKMKNLVNDNSPMIKNLQKYGKIENGFLMSVSTGGYKAINLCLPSNSLLLSLFNDADYEKNANVYNGQQPNFTCELTLHGLAGLRTFQCFSIKNLPRPYSPDDVIFQIVDVNHVITDGDWKTTIKAAIRPLRGSKKYSNGKDEFESTLPSKIQNLT